MRRANTSDDVFLAPKEIKAIAVLLEEELHRLCAASAPEAPAHESSQYRSRCKLIVLSLRDSAHQVYIVPGHTSLTNYEYAVLVTISFHEIPAGILSKLCVRTQNCKNWHS